MRAAPAASGLLAAAAFVGASALVATGATRSADRATLEAAQSVASPALDLAGSLLSILGTAEVTGALALALAIAWWRHEGARGLVPLLLFAGVAVELLMKELVPHPPPPPELSRELELLPFVKAATPFSFPSGHVLRTAFLAGLLGARASAAWRLVLGALVVAMAASRIYLADHWLSDTVGGLALGIALAALAAALHRRPSA